MNLKSIFKKTQMIISVIIPITLISCAGDITSSLGEEGNLRYSITTDYYINSSLIDSTLATKITHSIDVDLAKSIEAEESMIITHMIEPSSNSTITNTGSCPSYNKICVKNISLKTSSPGAYTITSVNGNKTIDYITLQFDEAETIDIIVKEREAYQNSFDIKSKPVIAIEGSQVVFIPIPTASDETRLIANGSYNVECNSTGLAVPGKNISDVNEGNNFFDTDGVWSWMGDQNYYLIEEGTVKFTITEIESNYQGSIDITVNKL
ncbi:hypothetical protein ACFL20_01755 [Spirochaetota bacterium]